MWTCEYNEDNDETAIYHDGTKIGQIDGRITSWIAGMPQGEAKDIIKNAVDDPMIVDLLYGFDEIRDE